MNGQSTNNKDLEKGTSIQRNTLFNLDEIKVRWKKAALENCPGVPCFPLTIPSAPTSVVATAGNASASVAFTAPASNGYSAITGYTVTSSPGSFTATGATSPINVTGLTNGTAYTFTVVATNAVGNSGASTASTAVTPVAPFTCGTSTVLDGSGNSYPTVVIGSQCWTNENLKATLYNDGITPIPDLTSAGWTSATTGARTEYVAAGVTGYVSTYGYLYNWYAVAGIFSTGPGATPKNICPLGWHVPTDTDWTDLINFLGTNPAGKMKENSPLWTTNIGTDDFFFSVRPGGFRDLFGNFTSIGGEAYFWSATVDASRARMRSLTSLSALVNRRSDDKKSGTSIRCLRD